MFSIRSSVRIADAVPSCSSLSLWNLVQKLKHKCTHVARHGTPDTEHQNTGQNGGFSPFLFGLIMGVAAFSALSNQWAKQELAKYQEQQVARAKANADDVAKGMDFAILTENTQTYSDNYDLERARQYTDTDARTRGGQDYLVTAREDEKREKFGKKSTTVAITGSDDTLLRSQMYRSGDSEEILRTKVGDKQVVSTYDTATARDRQVRTSNERMEVLAEQVYAFYAAKKRFPTDNEFNNLRGTFNLHDAWGREYTYTPQPDQQKGILSFTTPWNYTQTLKLSLKDDTDAGNIKSNEDTSTQNADLPVSGTAN